MEFYKLALGWTTTAVVFVLMISVLVAAHEYGHYLVGRIFRMNIEEFAIGFGPRIWTWRVNHYRVPLTPDQQLAGLSDQVETHLNLRAIPLGGFVRVLGMQPSEDRSELTVPGGFFTRSASQRFLMLLAGPVFSILAGILMFFASLVIWGQMVPDMTGPVVIGNISPNSPASAAGLKPNDHITTIDGAKIASFKDLQTAVQQKGLHPLTLTFDRAGKPWRVSITPAMLEGSPKLGISVAASGKFHVEAVNGWDAAALSVSMPWLMIDDLATMGQRHEKVTDNLGGPVRMVSETHDAVTSGPAQTVQLAAMLSISVGFFNLLPLSILDGGQMALCLMEMIRRRPIPFKLQIAFLSYGFIILLTMVFGILFLDVKRLVTPAPTNPAVAAQAPSK